MRLWILQCRYGRRGWGYRYVPALTCADVRHKSGLQATAMSIVDDDVRDDDVQNQKCGVSSVIFGKLPFSPSGQQRCSFFPIPGVRLGDGAGSCHFMGAWRQPLSMRPPRSRPRRSSGCQLAGIGDAGERRLATTRPRWSSSTGARRGDHPVADADQFDYLSKQDGQATILLSIFSRCDHALRAARGCWSLAVGRLGCSRA